MPADDRQKPQPPRFMVSIAFMETDWCDMLVDEGGYEAVVGVFAMLARLKSRDRNESTHSGAFPSERSLEHALGPFAKHIPLYRKAGVLDGLRTPLWDWQTKYDGDPERQRRYRERMAERERGDTGMDSDRDVMRDVTDDGQNPNQNPNPNLNEESPSGTRDTSTEDGWADWMPAAFRTAWHERGLRKPPTRGQQNALRGAVVDWRVLSIAWLGMAPKGVPVKEVVGHILDQYHAAVDHRRRAAG